MMSFDTPATRVRAGRRFDKIEESIKLAGHTRWVDFAPNQPDRREREHINPRARGRAKHHAPMRHILRKRAI